MSKIRSRFEINIQIWKFATFVLCVHILRKKKNIVSFSSELSIHSDLFFFVFLNIWKHSSEVVLREQDTMRIRFKCQK